MQHKQFVWCVPKDSAIPSQGSVYESSHRNEKYYIIMLVKQCGVQPCFQEIKCQLTHHSLQNDMLKMI